MRTEFFTKHVQMALYDDDPHRYVGSAQLYLYGDVVLVDSLLGADMLNALTRAIPLLKEAYGASRLEGFVHPPVLRAVRRHARLHGLQVEAGRKIVHRDHPLVWMTVTEKQDED